MVVTDGVTVKVPVLLEDNKVLPQLPPKSSHTAPAPSVPPLTVKVTLLPGHTVEGVAVTDTGAVDTLLMVTVVLKQLVVLQVPLPCT